MVAAAIRRRVRRTSQPQYPVGINWAGPNASGLVWAAEFGGDAKGRDATNRRAVSVTTGAPARVASRLAVGANLVSTVLAYGTAQPVTSSQMTIEVIFRFNNKSIVQGLINKRAAFNSSNSFALFGDFTSSGDVLMQFGNAGGTENAISYALPGASFAANVTYHLIVACDVAAGAGSKVSAWLDGVTLTATAVSDLPLSAITSTSAPLELGRVNNGTLYCNAAVFAARIYLGAFSAARADAHFENPWQILAPAKRSVWVPGAGGSFSLAAAASAAIQATATTSAAATAAVQAAQQAQASLHAAVREARAAAAAVAAAVQASPSASASVQAAVQQANTATASLALAVLAQGSRVASLAAAVQEPQQATAALTAMVQAGTSTSASLAAAVQAATSAVASLSVQVQAGTTVSATVDVAVREARAAVAAVQAAVATSTSATSQLAAVVAVQRSVAAAMDAALGHARSASAWLSVVIDDGTGVAPRVADVYRAPLEQRVHALPPEQRIWRPE